MRGRRRPASGLPVAPGSAAETRRAETWRARAAASAALLVAVAATSTPAYAIRDSEKVVGGGWVATGDSDLKVHFAVNLPCPAAEVGFNPQPDPPGRDALLQIRAGSDRFTLSALEAASCSDNLYQGRGRGTCNGTENGIIIEWRFVDAGRGGRTADSTMIMIHGAGCRLFLEGPLGGGNVTIGDEEN